uniref:GPI mannosyltransferase 2 n=1 Tax=Sphenodon punctatus TaxID=8508 RepID=A0A8D0HHP6_SPHPU
MMLKERRDLYLPEVIWFAVACRVLTLLLQALLNLLIPDHEADAFTPPRLSEPNLCDWLLEWLLGGLSRWDAEHFLFIAEHGYLYEHNYAFFPLYPLSLRAMAEVVLWPLQGVLRLRSRLLLSAVLLNATFSVLASAVLYELGHVVLRCRKLAFLSATLFCLSPANVFMAAAYSESMFALLAFSAMWQLEGRQLWTSGLLFSLAASVRSNGVINAGFIVYSQTKHLAFQLQAGAGCGVKLPQILGRFSSLAASVVLTFAGVSLPFALFQFYAYLRFCEPDSDPEHTVPRPLLQLALEKGYRVAGMNGVKPLWCSWSFPIVYTYIQDTYWNVGFLRYFEPKQIPNFLLAAPVIVLGLWSAWLYTTTNPQLCLTLGFVRRRAEGRKGENSDKPEVGFCCSSVFVYIVHAMALLVFGTLCMHVQVLTRFLGSSTPILYWFSAHLLHNYEPLLLWDEDPSVQNVAPLSGKPKPSISFPGSIRGQVSKNPIVGLLLNWRMCTPLTRCILGYFLSYWLLGLILHCNFLPWT